MENESKYLKGIFIAITIAAIILIGIFIVLVVHLNSAKTQTTKNEETEETTNINTTNEYSVMPELNTLADDSGFPPYPDDILDEVSEEPTTSSSSDITDINRLSSSDPDEQLCIDTLYNILDIIYNQIEQDGGYLGYVTDEGFANNIISSVLNLNLYSDEFMSDYAYYITNLNMDEKLNGDYEHCSYPFVPFYERSTLSCRYVLVESEILYINNQKIVKILINAIHDQGYLYFRQNENNEWKVYFTERIPNEYTDTTKEIYRNMTP